MALTPEQLDALMGMLSKTRAEEATCEECAAQLAEFAEAHLSNLSIPERLEAIGHHLALCGECREVYEALLNAMED